VSRPLLPDRVRGMLLGPPSVTPSVTRPRPDGADREAATARSVTTAHTMRRDRVGLPSDDSQLASGRSRACRVCELDRRSSPPASHRVDLRDRHAVQSSCATAKRRHASVPLRRESAGNGALMRIAPIVLLIRKAQCRPWLDAALASIVTHRTRAPWLCVASPICSPTAATARATGSGLGHRDISRHGAPGLHDQPYRPRGGHFTDREALCRLPELVLGEARHHG